MRKLNPIITYLASLRLKDWFYITGISFLGFFYNIDDININQLVYLLFISVFFVSHGYTINAYYDSKYEGCVYNKNNNQLLFTYAILSLVVNIIISGLYSKIVFLLVLLGTLVSFLYSSSWMRMKDKPLANIIFNSTGFTILFIIGYLFNKELDRDIFFLAGYIWLGIIPSQIIHLIAHRPYEKNWLFPLTISLKLFYLSQLAWLGWTFVVCSFLNHIYILFVLTLMFCITQVVIIKLYRRRVYIDMNNFFKIRKKFKYLHIVFGILFIIFLWFY